MAQESVCEISRSGSDCGDTLTTADAQSWLQLSLTDTENPDTGGVTELRTASAPVDGATRVWARGAGPEDDALTVLSWLRGNTLTDRLGVDTDLLVQLFIETSANGSPGVLICDGEFLATLAGKAQWAGTAATARWSLAVNLEPRITAAVLDAIADSDPRWRYALVAVRDPESPAGRVRRRLLDDLRGQ